jgi:ribosomal protein S18 acetylase RimI-like enzyme
VVLELPPGQLDPASVPEAGFRPAESSDAGTLREFELLYASEMGLEDPESDIDSLISEGMAYVHEEEGMVAGTVRSNLSDGRYVHVGGVFVHPRFRRRGIGAKLVAGVSERIHREGSSVILDAARENEPALRTYRSLGFHDAGEGVSLRFPEDAFRCAE